MGEPRATTASANKKKSYRSYRLPELERGKDGKYAVCFRNTLNLNDSDTRLAFMKYGEVCSVRCSGVWVFVRFHSKSEAQAAVDDTSLQELTGDSVKPAKNTLNEGEVEAPDSRNINERPQTLPLNNASLFPIGVDFRRPPPNQAMKREEIGSSVSTYRDQRNNGMGQGYSMTKITPQQPGNPVGYVPQRPVDQRSNGIMSDMRSNGMGQGYSMTKITPQQPGNPVGYVPQRPEFLNRNTAPRGLQNGPNRYDPNNVWPNNQSFNEPNQVYVPKQQPIENRQPLRSKQDQTKKKEFTYDANQTARTGYAQPLQPQALDERAAKIEKRAAIKQEKLNIGRAKQSGQKEKNDKKKVDASAGRKGDVFNHVVISNFPDELEVEDLWCLLEEKDIVNITIQRKKNLRYCHVYVSSAQKEAELLAMNNILVFNRPLLVKQVDDLVCIGLAEVSIKEK